MSRAQVVSRDEWGGDKATAAISAWRSAEEKKADRLLKQDAWQAQEALLRGDIDKYTGITGVTPQISNPNFESKKAELENLGALINDKYNKDYETTLESVKSEVLARGVNPGESDGIVKKEFQEKWKPIESKFQMEMDKTNQAMKRNKEYFGGPDYGKTYQNILNGFNYDRDVMNMSEVDLMRKWAPRFNSTAISYARNDPSNMFGPQGSPSKDDGQRAIHTVVIGNTPYAIQDHPNASAAHLAPRIKRKYAKLLKDVPISQIETGLWSQTGGTTVPTEQIIKNRTIGQSRTDPADEQRARGALGDKLIDQIFSVQDPLKPRGGGGANSSSNTAQNFYDPRAF